MVIRSRGCTTTLEGPMTAPTQGEIRTWARAQGMTVNARGSLPAATVAAYKAAHGSPKTAAVPAADTAGAPSAAVPDLADALGRVLRSIEVEVNAVSSLSESIDGLVGQLNAIREEQAARLTALDRLQASVDDTNLGAFLEKAIRPRKAKVAEVVPDRLQ